MRFSAFIGQEGLVDDLRKALEEGRVGHAYLFLGPEGIGRRTLATVFAQALLCERGEGEPCEACRSCLLVRAGTHPDLVTVVPEGGSLRIEQIRALRSQVAYRPLLGTRRVFLLAEMEKMTEAAANSFLLTLEDPPRGVVFLGWAAVGAQLLPTVISRCQVFTLRPLTTTALAEALLARGIDEEKARQVAAAAEGLPGKALRLLEAAEEDGEWSSFLRTFLADDLVEFFRKVEDLSRTERDLIRERLWRLEKMLGRSLVDRVRGGEGAEEFRAFDRAALRRLYEAVAAAGEHVRANANLRLVLENLGLTFYRERELIGREGG